MKLIDYILKFGFGIALGLVIIFKISPLLFNTAEELKNEVLQEDRLLFLSLECFVPNDYDDIKLTGELSNAKSFKNIYEVTNNASYDRLVKLLFRHNIIDKKELKGKLPFSLTRQQLYDLGRVKVKVNKDNQKIEKLTINDEYIIGSEPSIIRICLIYFLGGVIFILGLSSLIVTLIMLFKNLNIYNKTDKLPELPNTVESKIKGLKFLTKWFRRNNE